MKMISVALAVGLLLTGGAIVWQYYSLEQSVYEKTTKYDDYSPRGGINGQSGKELFPAWPSTIN